MRELVVISGKGGTGKTSLVAALAVLADKVVMADCDVDAADLHLVLEPTVRRREPFSGGNAAFIRPENCVACGECEKVCRFDAISGDGPANSRVSSTFRVDPVACEGCGVCVQVCEHEAIDFGPVVNGEWFVSETRCGPMVHARLHPGAENSGKLVSLVRSEARRIASVRQFEWVLIDGSPGIGCSVIASLAGADFALIVAEPTLSGLHDLERIADLTSHFNIETFLAVNKWDVNSRICGHIEELAADRGIQCVGRIRYDLAVTEAQVHGLSVVEHTNNGAASDVRDIWKRLAKRLQQDKMSQQLTVL
jgi:MinD superfamily P-loop ATPase